MKRTLAYKGIFAALILLWAGAAPVSAQQDHYGWRIGAGAGYMNYFGDVSPYQIKKWSDWDRVFRFFQYNKYYVPEAAYSISLERRLTPVTGLMFRADWGKISMSDRYRKPGGDYDARALHWNRALNFETTIQDAGAALLFRSDNGRLLPLNAFLAPYLYLGGGVSRFNVKGDLYDRDGRPYDYADPRVQPDGIYETPLRPLKTETGKEYADIAGYADLGIGLKLRLSSRVDLSVQTDIKYSFSDRLDDVSGKYKTHYASARQMYAAHPGTNVTGPSMNRGNNDGVNDIYIFNKITLRYSFGRKRPRRVAAPVIYQPGAIFYPGSSDTTGIPKDTSAYRPDSSGKQVPAAAAVNMNDSIMRDLDEIKNSLRSLRFAHVDQDYIIRRNVAQDRLTRLLARRGELQNKAEKTKQDSLYIRLYGLQADSLRHELGAIRRARMQLRRDMAHTPVITEYRDATRIMIYKDHGPARDTAYLPLIGNERRAPETDTLTGEAVKETGRAAGTGARPTTQADSIRQALRRLQEDAATARDTAYYRQLEEIKHRLDSLEDKSRTDSSAAAAARSAYERNEARIIRDSARAAYLAERTDSLRAIETFREQEERNGIQRFFDRFKRGKNRPEQDTVSGRYPAADTLYHSPDSIYTAPVPEEKESRIRQFFNGFKSKRKREQEKQVQDRRDSVYLNSRIPGYDRRLQDDNTSLLEAHQQEIARLNDEIKQLRRENQLIARQSPRVIYPDDDHAREIRKERREMERLNRELIRSNNRSRRTPAITPAVVLGTGNRDDDHEEELRDIQDELAALREAYEAKEDTQLTRLKSRLDSLQTQQRKASMAESTRAQVAPLQAKIDSLQYRLRNMQPKQEDTVPAETTPEKAFILADFPVVSVYFATGSYTLKESEKEKIRPVAEVAKKYPKAKLLINGHTDATGSKAVNQALSRERCNTVKNILVDEYGLDAGRLETEADSTPGRRGADPLQRRVDVQFK